jgi:hypothetical protein
VPHLQEIVGALWLRSIAVGNLAGAEPSTLQVDITQGKAIDDNGFQVELATVIENSFSIHQEGQNSSSARTEPQAVDGVGAMTNSSATRDLVQLAKKFAMWLMAQKRSQGYRPSAAVAKPHGRPSMKLSTPTVGTALPILLGGQTGQ